MDNMPLVTIILMTYKKFDNIFKALDSVFCQTYSNIELIVTDDGSPNFPKKEIEEYVKSNGMSLVKTTILDNAVNVGTVKHLNNAFRVASGKLIKCLAGDDQLYDENVVGKIVERYNNHPFNVLSTTSISFADDSRFFRFYPHYETGKIIEKIMPDAESQFKYLKRWQYHDLASGSTMVYNADFFHSIGGFDETYRLWEDGPFMYLITRLGYKIETAFDIISIRYSQGGVSSNGNSQIAREVGDLIKKTRDLYRNSDSLHNRRYVEFLNLAYSSKNKYERYINYLKYLDIFLCHQYYLYCEKRRGKKDLKYYKLLINK